jgi:hypothetical protein
MSAVMMGGLSIWRERSLACRERELEQAPVSFAFIADVTILAFDCRFAGDAEIFAARYDGLLLVAIAFHDQDTRGNRANIWRRITALTRGQCAPDETFYCLVGDERWSLVESPFRPLENCENSSCSTEAAFLHSIPEVAMPLARGLAEMEALSRRGA